MKPKNLISTLQGDRALNILDRNIGKEFKTLKSHEIRVLDAFCKDMISYGCEVGDFDGFFVSYEIPQISKEFDLLRFGVDCVLNIELKSELKVANKHQKIFDQLRKNEYYLKFLGKPTKIFAYVENDGYYSYTPEDNKIEHISSLLSQKQNEAKQLEIEAVRQREVDYKNALQEIEDFLSTDDRLVGMSKKGVRQEYADTLRIRWSEKIGQNITQKDVRIIVERVYLRRMTNQNA